MSNQEGKRWYYPLSEIEEAKLAKPGEFIVQDTLQPYIGVYCIARGHILTGARPTPTSKILIPAVDKHENTNTMKYFEITGIERNNHSSPLMYIPEPSEDDYANGQFQRYFIQKFNEPNKIYEIDSEQYKDWNVENKNGPDGILYHRFELQWMLKGKDAVQLNRKNVDYRDSINPGMKEFLGNLDQFVKGSIAMERFYDDGTEIPPNLPATYGVSPFVNKQCEGCKFFNNNYCTLWQSNVRKQLWCKSWAEPGTYGIPANPTGQYWMFVGGDGTVYYDDPNSADPMAFTSELEYFTHRENNGYPRDWSGIEERVFSEE